MIPLRRAALRALPALSNISKLRRVTPISISDKRPLQQSRRIVHLQFRSYSNESTSSANDGVSSTENGNGVAVENSSPIAVQQGTSLSSPENEPTVFIGNIPRECTEKDLEVCLSKYGEISYVRVHRDRVTRQAMYAFASFTNQDGVDTVMTTQVRLAGEELRIALPIKKPMATKVVRPPAVPSCTLYVGNISRQISDAELQNMFKGLESLLEVRVAVDKETGIPRGFAHAEFGSVDNAANAKEKLAGKSFYGRDLRVDFASERAPRRTEEESSEP